MMRVLGACALALALVASADAQTRAAAPAAGAGGDGIRYLILVRHGIYDPDTSADDVHGNGLNALGHAQAKLVGERLGHLPVKIALLATSDYRRASETADDIGRALGMTPARDALLRECMPTADPGSIRFASPAIVSASDAQLAAAWARYARPSPLRDEHDVLVCHGNVIRWFVARALGLGAMHWPRMEIANGSLTVIAVHADGSTKLVAFSDTGHIPPEQQTWTGKGAGWARSRAGMK